MKKVLALVLAFVFVSAAAFAGDARIAGLNLKPWMTTDDDSIIKSYPAQINKFSNEAWVELGTKGSTLDNYYGAQLPLGGGTLAVVLNQPVTVNPLSSPGSDGSWNVVEPNLFPSVTNIFGASYGLMLDKVTSLAVGVKFGSKGDSETKKADGAPEASVSAMYLGVNAGLGIEGSLPMDFALSFDMPMLNGTGKNYSATNVVTIDETNTNAGTMNIGLSGRLQSGSAIFNAGLGIGLDAMKSTLKADTGDVSDDLDSVFEEKDNATNLNVALGAANAWKPVDGIQFVLGAEAVITSSATQSVGKNVTANSKIWDNSSAVTGFAIPVYASVEGKIIENLTGRIGIKQEVWQNETTQTKDNMPDTTPGYDDPTLTSTSNPANGVVSMGLSFAAGKLTLDGVLSQALLFDGPDFIGGVANGISSNLTATYAW